MAELLILIRHGDLGDRRRGRYIGRTDAPLSAEGKRQAAALAGPLARLPDGASVLVSPLRRTRETAAIALGWGTIPRASKHVQGCHTGPRIASEASFDPASSTDLDSRFRGNDDFDIYCCRGANFAVDSDLREIDFGRWEGMGFAEILAADPAAVDRWAALVEDFAFPDGESIGNFRKRIGAAAGRIAADPAGTAVVFTHGGVIRFLICHFLGLPDRAHLLFDVRPASISEIRIDGGKGVLTLLNDRRHLEMD